MLHTLEQYMSAIDPKRTFDIPSNASERIPILNHQNNPGVDNKAWFDGSDKAKSSYDEKDKTKPKQVHYTTTDTDNFLSYLSVKRHQINVFFRK
jgi:hypothetical protein